MSQTSMETQQSRYTVWSNLLKTCPKLTTALKLNSAQITRNTFCIFTLCLLSCQIVSVTPFLCGPTAVGLHNGSSLFVLWGRETKQPAAMKNAAEQQVSIIQITLLSACTLTSKVGARSHLQQRCTKQQHEKMCHFLKILAFHQ